MTGTGIRMALAGAFFCALAPLAAAQTASCQADLDKHASGRLDIIKRINAFAKKRPTAKQACATFGELVATEGRMLKWMEDNKDWCRLPDQLVEDFRKGSQNAVKARGQACTAAKREAAGGGAVAAPRGAQPGSGIPLPKGAL